MTHTSGFRNESSPVEGLGSSVSVDETRARRAASTHVDAPSRASRRPAAPGSRRARRQAERAAAAAAAVAEAEALETTDLEAPDLETGNAQADTTEPVAEANTVQETHTAPQPIVEAPDPEPAVMPGWRADQNAAWEPAYDETPEPVAAVEAEQDATALYEQDATAAHREEAPARFGHDATALFEQDATATYDRDALAVQDAVPEEGALPAPYGALEPLSVPDPNDLPEPKPSKAGRNLPAAIGVGAGLLAVLGLGLFVFPYLLIALGCLVAGIGSWEVSRALKARTGIPIPLAPLLITSVALPLLAGIYGPVALSLGLTACLVLVVIWNLLEGRSHGSQSIGLSVLVVGWVPLLASFAFLIFQTERGAAALLTVVLLVVSNDTFGYIVGVTLGKHPMAARISPKKSWEGFAGSLLGATIVGIALCLWVLQIPWWLGVVLAIATVVCATLGDFAESMVKRALGVKDMSNLLPGHGGMMDRLDSLLFAMPFGYAVVMLAEALA
ncbi:phosphatidate cytidylyltransferase [Pseudoglutamicibacter albus]|uniref:phosphatidate cytidylyltransferase n=1 Tax=Pseudoglutamicibacter albus TaxID=98671 RepID=UPI000B23D0E7|nr:phosphatidate cytidylyltransferase [Pseudoglutamicibacter albus]